MAAAFMLTNSHVLQVWVYLFCISHPGKREQDVVVQIARRDMPKGEEIFVWPGRLSNSEMIARCSLHTDSDA